MDLRPGAVIAGRYRVDRKVGSGGMGEVWSGDHLAIGSKVALKTMLPAAAVNHEVVARFKREAFLLGKIRSDYVARVVDFVADDNFGLVLVMEFIEGVSLARILTERGLTVEETIEVGADLASALCDLHRAHIVHRDLKPGNVILSPLPGGRQRAVVVDFGVSRLMSQGDENEETITGITRADMAVGTIEYMSPEQILNSRSVTAASDIYAIGAILFRAVAGHHVFGDVQGESELAQFKLTQEAPSLPTPGRQRDRLALGLRDAVARTLRRRPSERFTSADQMVEAFAPLRDLVRVEAFELDSTTQDNKHHVALEPTGRRQRAMPIPASYLVPADVAMHQVGPPSDPRPPFQSTSNEQRISFPYGEVPGLKPSRGVPIAAAIVLIGGALGLGALASWALIARNAGAVAEAPSATASAEIPSASATASAAPEPTVAAAPSATASAAASDSASPVASASASAPTGRDAGAPWNASPGSLAPFAHPPPTAGLAPAPGAPPASGFGRPKPKPEPPPLDLDAPPPPVNPRF